MQLSSLLSSSILTLTFFSVATVPSVAQTTAFPGAEGFGALATGGRASKHIVHVTNLKASGPGSLAEAVSHPNRIVVFDVGGIIKLAPGQMIDVKSNITIEGQTAPGNGITIYGNRVLIRQCENVIVRYLRMRGSINMGRSDCTLTMDNANNVILDHCSISWGRWDNVHIKNASNITWQYCIISEGIDPQRFGAITDGTSNWTISHCLWINNKSRNPKMKCRAQMVNSVVYNGGNGVVGGHSAADNYQDLINNYYIAGPQGNSAYSQWTATDHLYQTGNLLDADRDGTLNGQPCINTGCTNMPHPQLSPTVPVKVESPAQAFKTIVAQAGCSKARDSHDARLIGQLKSLGTIGQFIDNETQVGGIGTIYSGIPITDTDHDGMPDDWEKSHGLDPSDASDATLDRDNDGYLNIEEYANSLAVTGTTLLNPTDVQFRAVQGDPTSGLLSWSNLEDRATAIYLEQSYDGHNYLPIDTLDGRATQKVLHGIDPTKTYYYRLRYTDGTMLSPYSAVVCINEPEGTHPGGGTAAGTTTFTPQQGKLYRIISYANRLYNSGANLSGAPMYMQASGGVLSTTTNFDRQDPALLWTITPTAEDPTRFVIRHYKSKEAISATTVNDQIPTSADHAASLTINYVGDRQAPQSGQKGSLAFYRINSPDNKNFQIRGKSAPNRWFWGSGTLDRADMIFTFQAIDAKLIGLYVKELQNKIVQAEALLQQSKIGTGTLQYPQEAYKALSEALKEARPYSTESSTSGGTQAQIDSVCQALTTQMACFSASRNNYWGECDTTKVYNIFSYGMSSGSGTTTATASMERRYLVDSNGVLVYQVGLTDADEPTDPLHTMPMAQWKVVPDTSHRGLYWINNVQTGRFLQVATVSNTKAPIFLSYNNTDNGYWAFSIRKSADSQQCINIGDLPTGKNTGPLTVSTIVANRTRLRWVFREAGEAASTAIHDLIDMSNKAQQDTWYNLQGQQVVQPQHGIFIHRGHKVVLP